MRIVQYHPRAGVGDGGVSNSVRRLSAAMVRAGAEVLIAHETGEVVDGAAAQAGDAGWHPVRHVGVRGVHVPVDLDRALAGADAVILNSAWTTHNVRAGAVAAAMGVPYVVADRGAYDPLILQRRQNVKRAWWWLLEQRLVQRARALHVFFASQEQGIRELGYDGDLLVAPNGVTAPIDDMSWDGGSGGYIAYVGRFDPEHKGLDLLVRAVASLPAADRPQIRMNGPDWRGGKPALETLVADLRLEEWITIGGPVYGEEKWQLITRSLGFVYPSRWEAFGNSPAEAAALGVPVMVTGYPLGTYLADHDAAILAKGTVAGLAEGLLALGSPDAAAVGRRASSLVTESFTWDAVARQWLSQLGALTG